MAEIPSPLFGGEYHKRGVRTYPQCAVCGRRLKGKTKWVHYLTSGKLTTDADHPETQGFWEIGPECGKKIPAEYKFEF